MMIMGIKVEWATNLLLLIKINIDFYNESLYAILNLKTLKEKDNNSNSNEEKGKTTNVAS
jgi:hypothetical protein